MKRFSTAVLFAVAASLGLAAISATPSSAAQGNTGTTAPQTTNADKTVAQANAPDFGSPPSGEIPILYNDRHVYAKPDREKQSRVLAAIVRDNTILVPLRSMFEQMGATVSYDPASKTLDVAKPGSDAKVTVGKPEIIVNGESRPLDVPPEIYQGTIVAPVRVLSEAMGAYVQWIPEKRVVVVRYIPPPPPATPAPTPPPPPPPPKPIATPVPTPVPTSAYEAFVAGDYLISPKVYDEYSPGNTGQNSWRVHGAIEFPLFGLPWMLAGDYEHIAYQHNASASFPNASAVQQWDWANGIQSTPGTLACPVNGDAGCVTTIGGQGNTWVTPFQVQKSTYEGKFGLKVIDPRIYVAIALLERGNNNGYPGLFGVGFGAEKLPDLNHSFSWDASFYYYPSISGNYTDGFGTQYTLSYSVFRYEAGITYQPLAFPVFLEAGVKAEQDTNRSNAPSNWNEVGIYAGLGYRFY